MLHHVVHIEYKDLVHQMQLKNEELKYIELFIRSILLVPELFRGINLV